MTELSPMKVCGVEEIPQVLQKMAELGLEVCEKFPTVSSDDDLSDKTYQQLRENVVSACLIYAETSMKRAIRTAEAAKDTATAEKAEPVTTASSAATFESQQKPDSKAARTSKLFRDQDLDFAFAVSKVETLPPPGSAQRKSHWNQLVVNKKILVPIGTVKNGIHNFKLFGTPKGVSITVSFNKNSLRPVFRIDLRDEITLEVMANDDANKVFVSRPAYGCRLDLQWKMDMSSNSAKNDSRLEVELQPTRMASIFHAALALKDVAEASWVGDEKLWKWDTDGMQEEDIPEEVQDAVALLRPGAAPLCTRINVDAEEEEVSDPETVVLGEK